MKSNELKFKKGEFITQSGSPESFAIFGGDVYEPSEGETETLYSLICYYNPSHYELNSNGKWEKSSILEYDFEDNDHDEVCEYTISSEDFDYWRLCSKREVETALKMLAETKKLAWNEVTYKFRKLGPNEHLVFDEPKSTGIPGGNVQNRQNNPFYQNSQANNIKLITRAVKEDWEQKEPISSMDDEKKAFVAELCEKVRFYSTPYNSSSVRVYPSNGMQVPRRMGFGDCGWPGGMGYGMCAYNALMNGEMWGAYDDYGD